MCSHTIHVGRGVAACGSTVCVQPASCDPASCDCHTMQAQSFPVDESDRDSFLRRAATAITPLMDLLYQKALHTYDSIFDPTVSNFDKRFRIQNAQRLLKYVSHVLQHVACCSTACFMCHSACCCVGCKDVEHVACCTGCVVCCQTPWGCM